MLRMNLIFLLAALTLGAQSPVPPPATVPLYQVTISQRSATAINYRYMKSSTKIDFKGTALAAAANGMAKVSSEATTTHIKASFEDLPNPNTFGAEYLTYVLWAISPEGRASNLGEVLIKKGKGKLTVTEPLQAFGLIVTAEPYFAVTAPSDVVVLENAVRKDTEGKVELIDAKFELLKRGQYQAMTNAPAAEKDTPFAVIQARNAVFQARAAGAQTYATDAYGKAEQLLAQSEAASGSKKEKAMAAREATQGAEDARMIAIKRQDAERIANDQKMAQAKLDQARADAANAAAVSAAALASADRSLAAADRNQAAAQNENKDLKAKLLVQFNSILQTRATARGLIVNMSGVTFQTGKAVLLPGAREKLAKIAGIVLAHPGLKLESEGYTDNTGSDQVNDALSAKRAEAARDYLVSQGVASSAIEFRGLGKASPIDTNDSAAGRQNNRRVELVVSGAGITAGI